ncbi:hypothetical protein TWF694_005312 [Orbilia ellipsospora]|uniref:Integral membrane protein n=1 Tax=Orbilia ellipsospora TaxID=2528407 RepID=A0AAV9WTY8_9PEZI
MAEVRPIKRCEGRVPITSERHWYYLPEGRDLKICSRCFHDHLKNTPFANNFTFEYCRPGIRQSCDFNTPRMIATLHQALQQGNFDTLKTFIVSRSGVKRCKENGGQVLPDEGYLWFEPRDPSLHGKLAACQACYEDFVLASGIAQHFSNTPIKQPEHLTYICDLGWPFAQKFLKQYNDWNQIFNYLVYRANLPACAGGDEVDSSSRKWYQMRAPDLTSIWMCEACYYDIAALSPMEQHVYCPQQPLNVKLTCFASGSIPLRVAWNEAVAQRNFNVFYQAARVFVNSPPCTGQGVTNGVWYSLNPPAKEVDVCSACYAGILVPCGVGHLMVRKMVPPGETRLCDMNLASPRAVDYLAKLDLGIDTGDDTIFPNYARRISETPLCSHGQILENHRWYCHDMFISCPSCYLEVIEGEPLESCFTARNELYSNKIKCDFYSARVRNIWREANDKNDLPGFVAFMTKRLEIWKQTYPEIQKGLAMMRMNMERQATLHMSSLMLTGANSIASAAGVDGNWGNSSVGYGYATSAGVEGAMQFNQAVGMGGANVGLSATIMQLEALWKSVE